VEGLALVQAVQCQSSAAAAASISEAAKPGIGSRTAADELTPAHRRATNQKQKQKNENAED
jgi:hypothetical protein